jgi:hypothetical protein
VISAGDHIVAGAAAFADDAGVDLYWLDDDRRNSASTIRLQRQRFAWR